MSTRTIQIKGKKYLVLEDSQNTLAAMVIAKEVPVYWIDDTYHEPTLVERVEHPQTIFGASPNQFAILIDR
mgnify:CR=1 FL=1